MAVHLDPSPVESFVESLCNSAMDCGASQVDSPPQMFTKQLCPQVEIIDSHAQVQSIRMCIVAL